MDIIDEIYYSDIYRVMDIDKEYANAIEKLRKLETEIIKSFPECKNLLDEYKSFETAVISLAQKNDFIRGFKIGSQIAIEVMTQIK